MNARPARSCSLSMHWIVASHKREGAGSVAVVGETYQPTDATIIELPDPRRWKQRHFARTLATLQAIQGRPHLRGFHSQRNPFGS